MQLPPPEKLLLTVDRTASELLWSVSQFTEQSADPQLRRRAAEIIDVVISGLSHNHNQLTTLPRNPIHD